MATHAFHNALFVEVFTNNKELATVVLKIAFSEEQISDLDFRTLKFKTTVDIDAEVRELRADAIVSLLTKGRLPISGVIEHKSTQSKDTFIQVLSYQTIQLTNTNGVVKIVPIVVSTAKKSWSSSRRFSKALTPNYSEVWQDEGIDFKLKVVDFASLTIEMLQTMPEKARPHLLALKVMQAQTPETLGAFFVSNCLLPKREQVRLAGQLIYCLVRSGVFSVKVIERVEMEHVKNKGSRVVPRIKIGEEGWREEGRQEGRQEGFEETALNLLEEGVSIEVICRATGLTRADLARLKKKRA